MEAELTTYLTELARAGRKHGAAKAAGLKMSFIQDLRKDDPEFAEAEREALQVYGESLEKEAHRRGVEGWDEPVFYKGDVCGHVQRFSDRLLELSLKKNVPEWRDKVQVDAKLTGGVLVVAKPAPTPEDWAGEHGGEGAA